MADDPIPQTAPTGREVLSDTTGLTQLGGGASKPARSVECFPWRHRGRDTIVSFHCEEFTCFCPLTGQPDYAVLDIEYAPRDRAIESKSLKNYLWSFRDSGVFHEDLVNVVLEDLSRFADPKWIRVTARFKVRGGIAIDAATEAGERPAAAR